MKHSTYNRHFIYIRFDEIERSFIKIDFIIDGLDYCNVVNIPLERLRNSCKMIADGIFVPKDEYIYLDRLMGYFFFSWKKDRTLSYLRENILRQNF